METGEENKLSIPLILKYCFKNIKQMDGSDVNVSAACNICSKTIKGSVTSSTNFLKHLKIKGHSDQLQDYENFKSTTLKKRKNTEISSSGASGSQSTCKKLKQSTLTDVSGSRSVNLDKLIVQFIVDTMSPVSIVENKSFKALIEGSQQLTKPPKVMCRITAKNKISDEYNEFKKNLKLEFDNLNLYAVQLIFGLHQKEVTWGLQSIGLKVRLLKGRAQQLLAEDLRGLTHMKK